MFGCVAKADSNVIDPQIRKGFHYLVGTIKSRKKDMGPRIVADLTEQNGINIQEQQERVKYILFILVS